ncbi:3-oxoacyl-ACP reductase [Haematobacter massiliensis]|uniref:3-oxoacyl-ACP reductase n=1 Tax=Haematobacter massiliensis TaxID=195105 RepID=A0A086Y2Q7_9RHOB|nr:SDR family NAD(P)-dependent oxidoreductase [Haematobacter massiliensis]KFI28557.1 3-oxoacyl-ACP reductase [Haematobacter massiliensis]OWJ74036.1 3-oxoacyl-ACP reductase [Haematobacter massiliensis]OWJ85206.1 3-oxoacyl-ACP reductase [Haematobacter massiliensis]QBJ26107.1 SDR family NAD(P)-dependent oxidoreductase [Haematobacter massiliensis]
MSISYEGRVAIVTGAGGGLGRAYALELARRGAKVVVNDFGGARDGRGGSSAAAEAVVAEIEAQGGAALADGGNVTDFSQMEALAARARETFGRIDVLINNAGILRDRTFAKMTMDDFRAVVEVHLIGSANATKAVWETMREQGYGRVLMTSSTSGVYGNFGQANYGAAKAGLIGLMNVLHFEGQKYGIHVNAVLPTAATRMTGDMMEEETLAHLSPENVVPAALYLTSEGAPSRTALLAGAGTVARLAIVENQGVYLPEGDRTPEAVAEAFGTLAKLEGFIETQNGLDHVERIVARARDAKRAV